VITVTGNTASSGAHIIVDAFDVTGGGGTAPGGDATTRVEDTNPAVSYTGTWVHGTDAIATGGTFAEARPAGAAANFRFMGTAVRWLGFLNSNNGIARVSVDGVFKGEVDTYSASLGPAVVFTSEALAPGEHTLTIEVTGRRNPASTDTWVIIDAFDVTGSGGATTAARIEENNPAVSAGPGGAWLLRGAEIAAFSSGTAGSSEVAGASVTLPFTGTAVSWIGLKCNTCGIASVSIDGGAATSVNTAGPAAVGSPGLASEPVFTASGLAAGVTHTLVITVTGNTASSGAHIIVDAFDVTP
jgi:bacillopeptidase F